MFCHPHVAQLFRHLLQGVPHQFVLLRVLRRSPHQMNPIPTVPLSLSPFHTRGRSAGIPTTLGRLRRDLVLAGVCNLLGLLRRSGVVPPRKSGPLSGRGRGPGHSRRP